jgi:hypothetical protein
LHGAKNGGTVAKRRENACGDKRFMKITRLSTFVVPPRWLFLKIETDEGVTGWGEPIVEGRAETVAACVAELADYLVGKDPSAIEDHWTVLYRGGFYRGGAVHMSALAGIDQALWDIKGKALDRPVHVLLGGPVRQKMRVYNWIGGDRPADIVAGAKDVAAKGFTAIKMLATEEMAWIDSHAKIDAVLARVAALRDAMGPDFGIAVDFHGRLHRPMAKVLAKELDPFRLMFIEEPVLSEHAEALREIANHTSTPIALGERLFSRWDFKKILSGWWTSSSLIRRTPAASPRPARSPPWRKPMTWRWRRIARWDRSRWPPACSWMRCAITPSSRNRAWASITTRATTCWITWWIRRCSPMPMAMSRSRKAPGLESRSMKRR